MDGQITQGSPYQVRGVVADTNTTVEVNGITANLVDMNFTADIPLNEGDNPLTITATGSNGAITIKNLNINYQPVAITVSAGSDISAFVDFITTPTLLDQIGGRQWSFSLPSGVTYTDDGQTKIPPDRLRINYTVAGVTTMYLFTVNYSFVDKDDATRIIFTDKIDFVLTVVP